MLPNNRFAGSEAVGILVAGYFLWVLADSFFRPASTGVSATVNVFFVIAIATLHGLRRYSLKQFFIFFVIAFIVSNFYENLSILTGFPFGHYHYTDALGPKLFLVPVLIGPAYIGTGYLSWVIATVLVSDIRRGSSAFTTFATPLIAAFVMVVWDLCFDPSFSTIAQRWIWEQGGGFFGVPLTNYLGWFFSFFVFYQSFSLSIHFGGFRRVESPTMPRSFYFQAVALYATMG